MTQQPDSCFGLSASIGAAEVFAKLGDEYAEQGRWATALELYNEAIKRYPDLANAYYGRGVVYNALEKYHQARDDFDNSIRLGLHHAQLYFQRGYTLYRIIRAVPTLALNDYHKAIQLDPHCVDAYYWRGRLWYEAEQHERAIQDFTKVIELKPDYDAAYSHRGSAYYELFQVEAAIADFTHVIERNNYEKMHFVYYNRAIAYKLGHQYTLAIQDYAEAIRIQADFQEALSGRFEIYKEIDQLQKALEDATKLINLEPNELSHYLKRARVYEKIGEYQKSVADFSEVIRRSVSFPDVNFERAEVFLKMGLYDWAIADYDYMINHYPFEPGKQKARARKEVAIRLRNKP
jgi:tetratricopeptide (TPR) repeat protein